MSRRSITAPDFVNAAIEFLDTNTHDTLTTRALGDLMGVDHTALYRHFPNKEALLGAVVDQVIGEAVAELVGSGEAPRQRLETIAHAIRSMFRRHPNIGEAIAMSPGITANAVRVTRSALDGLRGLGLQGRELVRSYQLFESFVLGASMYDMNGAPDHTDLRRTRYRSVETPELDDASRNTALIDDLTEEAFDVGIRVLLDSFEGLAATT